MAEEMNGFANEEVLFIDACKLFSKTCCLTYIFFALVSDFFYKLQSSSGRGLPEKPQNLIFQ